MSSAGCRLSCGEDAGDRALLQYLPPLPDAATLEAMPLWAGGGALIGLGAWALTWIAKRNASFGGGGWEPPPVEVPGFKPPADDDHKATSPAAALRLAVGGAVSGALMAWMMNGPMEAGSRLQLAAELLVLAGAAFVLLRTVRDIPVVGEAPPDDPDHSFAVRVRNAGLKLAGAAGMLALVWLTLD